VHRIGAYEGQTVSKSADSTLLLILEELKQIRQALVKPLPPTPEELERDLTVTLGVGPEDFGNR
jgi:hypothetical protein